MIRKSDPRLDVQLAAEAVELDQSFAVELRRSPDDRNDNSGLFGKVRAVRVSLGWFTEGRGDKDHGTVAEAEVPTDQYGALAMQVPLWVPGDSPVSYDGRLIRVLWEIEIRTDTRLAIDPVISVPVLVVPRGGIAHYRLPHPLPPR